MPNNFWHRELLMTLKEVAQVHIGLIVSRVKHSNKASEGGDIATYKYFTLSSAEHDGTIDKSKLKDIDVIKKIDDKYLSKEGDIIVGISAPHSVACIDKSCEGIIVPSQFIMIRVTGDKIIPEYLFAYLNSADVKTVIDKMAKGVTIITIDAESLQKLTIPIPSLSRQQKIAHLSQLIQEDNHLGFALAKLRKTKNDYHLNKFLAHTGEEQS